MNFGLVKRTNVAMAIAILAVFLYVGVLLLSNYHSQTRFIHASEKRFIAVFEKESMVVGHFFLERKQELKALSDSKEVLTYFENKALGMSLKYGLATSLMEMQGSFERLLNSRKTDSVNIYNWIAFVKPDGVPMTRVDPEYEKSIKKSFSPDSTIPSLKCMDFILEKRNGETHAIIKVPCYFKKNFKGYIAADLTLNPLFNNILSIKNMDENSGIYLFCTESEKIFMGEDIALAKRISQNLEKEKDTSGIFYIDGTKLDNKKQAVVYACICDTPFYLINVFPEDQFSFGITPRDNLLVMLGLFILIFSGLVFFIRSNIQKRLLLNQFQISDRNARQFQQQNEKLSMEIAERKKMEQKIEKVNKALKETSATLNYILKSASEFAIGAIDSEYRIIHFNPAAERILNVNKDEIMGQIIFNISHLQNVKKERFESAMDIARKLGKYECDIIRQNPMDKGRRLHAVLMPMQDDDFANLGFIFFVIDTTAQYLSEEKLRLSEEKYRTLIQNMPDIVLAIDADFLVTSINLPKIHTYALKEKDIAGKAFEEFIHEDDRMNILKLTRMDVKDRKKFRHGLHFRIVGGDGYLYWVDLNLHYQYRNDGVFLGSNGVIRDITDQKLLEGQLIRTERLAAAGQLAASIAHEINSPLAGISALLALVRKRNLDDESALEELDLIGNAFENIGSIVQKLLNLNRPGLDLMQRINVNTIIRDTVKLSSAYLKRKGIIVNLHLSFSVPDFDCYPQELGQVFLNFINNTIEAMDAEARFTPKLVTISTRLSDNRIVVEYMDNGPGIPDKNLDKIFDPFFTSKKTFGMGVGLSICHDIIMRHNGTIKALPYKKGARFTIEFQI